METARDRRAAQRAALWARLDATLPLPSDPPETLET